jgi:hypothetical protein
MEAASGRRAGNMALLLMHAEHAAHKHMLGQEQWKCRDKHENGLSSLGLTRSVHIYP